MLLCLLTAILFGNPAAIAAPDAVEVTLLTPQGSKILKTWTHDELKQVSSHRGEISAQKFILEDSTQGVDLNERANIDLVTIFGSDRVARVPRFLIWRGLLKLERAKDGTLSSKGQIDRLLVPASIFSVSKINKIELSRASIVYPGIQLAIRTNPAASRGEKLFSQSCLACHGLPGVPLLNILNVTDAKLVDFATQHQKQGGLSLDPKAARGLIAYREALKKERSEVKPKQ